MIQCFYLWLRTSIFQQRQWFRQWSGNDPLQPNVPFLYPLKTSENQRFSDVFRGYRNVASAWNGLACSLLYQKFEMNMFCYMKYSWTILKILKQNIVVRCVILKLCFFLFFSTIKKVKAFLVLTRHLSIMHKRIYTYRIKLIWIIICCNRTWWLMEVIKLVNICLKLTL